MKKINIITLLVFVFVSISVSVFASEGSEGGSHIMEWVWKVINFAILAFILWYFGKGPLRAFLKNRTEMIQKTLDEARQARELAEKALKEVEEKLKTKDSEVEGIIAASKESGQRERDALIEEGKRMSEKIIEQAKANIEFELKRAKEEIKAEAVEIALELAEKKIKEKLTPEEQKRLIEESLTKLEGSR